MLVVKLQSAGMSKPIISRRLWWTFAWGASIALAIGYHYEMDYRDRLAALPSIVDERGRTASVETAMAGIESYARARRVRKFGFVSLGVGLVLFICAAGTKRAETHVA